MQHCNFLLIGQGLAGSTLALCLVAQGQKVQVIDNLDTNSASRVAAGLFNPITGNQFVKTWQADVIFPALFNFYTKAEQTLQHRFFFPLPLYKPLDSIEKQNAWLAESSDPSYALYVDTQNPSDQYNQTVFNEFGGITLKQTGYLNVKEYVEATTRYLQAQSIFENSKFIENEVVIKDNKVHYRQYVADHLIFCGGYKDANSRLWSWLPFSPAKGDILFVDFEQGSYEHIINRGCWILPMAAGYYKVGSTYHWDEFNEIPTERARKELTEKLDKLSRLPYQIRQQVAGVRPSSSDRKPFIGQHPAYKQYWLFNGFGTKGVSLVPYYAQQFAAALVGKGAIEPIVNVARSYKKYGLSKSF